MKFLGISINVTAADARKYSNPVLTGKEFTYIDILHSDEDTVLPGSRSLKKGSYLLMKVRKAFVGKGMVYELRKKGGKYIHCYSTEAIDKMIDLGLINSSKQA